jgi:SAM-dependent methyltransferase
VPDYDPRLVDLYDVDNPSGLDHDFYRGLVDAVDARGIVDLGCGTGLLTVTLAGPGRTVIGIDPSAAMLRLAAGRPDGDQVRWVLGDSRDLDVRDLDLAVMTGNVAQHILGADWPRTLTDLRRALRPGGVLAFESRNPAARDWEKWALAEQDSDTRDTPHGPLREWADVSAGADGLVTATFYNVFEATGDRVVETMTLAFRDQKQLTRQLDAAGFTVEAVWGDWKRMPFQGDAPVMVVEARRR